MMSVTCKEAARMVSEGLDKDLGLADQVRLHAHLAICRGCRSISERMSFLRRAVKRAASRDDLDPS